MSKYGRIYHIIHHAEEVRDLATELEAEMTGVQGDKRRIALYVAAGERVDSMDAEDKIDAILQSLESDKIKDFLMKQAKELPAYKTDSQKVDDALSSIVHQLICLFAFQLEGLPLGEP